MDWSTLKVLGDVMRTNAALYADKTAFIGPNGAAVSFSALNLRTNALNNAVTSMGVRKGARVAILSRNRPEYIETYGLSKSGIIVVPLNWRLAAPEIVRLLRHSRPEILIVEEAYADMIEPLRAELESVAHFVSIGDARDGWMAYEDLIRGAQDDEPQVAVTGDDVACLLYTSGTTGAPKGVALTHDAVMEDCRAVITEMFGLRSDDVTLAVMPLFHVGGMWYHMFPSFAAGCTTILLAEFEPGKILRTLEEHRITNVHLVPTMIGAMINHPLAATVDLGQLRSIFYAASSMPVDLLKRAMLTFRSCGFVQAYGSTEAGVMTVLTAADHLNAGEADREHILFSCGRPIASSQIRVVDDADDPVAAGAVGEISVRSKKIMREYWLDPEATQRVLADGWLRTGDLGYLDDAGYLYIRDRKNDMIVTGGENVFPTEVEEFLYRDPDVFEAAVFGIPDPQWVEKVVAVVVLKPGAAATPDDIIKRLRGKLAAYKCPKSVFLSTDLPKNAAGKILRKDLRKQYGTDEQGVVS
ncbi:MAG: long-chain-fatty-acid--CoA ligase [Pseudomonadota bacterium]